MSYPSYIDLAETGELTAIRLELQSLLKSCTLCPRVCKVNRLSGERGFCRTGKSANVSSYGPHFGEESPLVGVSGSGTVFFTFCNLGCIFCQNYDISHMGRGDEVGGKELSAIFLKIKDLGCHNLNLVTPTHVIPQILEALEIAVKGGFNLPIVYNCGGYESSRVISKLSGIIDIYMPDLKFMDDDVALELTGAKNYSSHVKESIIEMHRQVGDLVVNEYGIAISGLIVRHLILPDNLAGTGKAIEFISEEVSMNTYLNLMDQYRPCYMAENNSSLSRRIYPDEFKRSVDRAKSMGLHRIDGEL